MLLTGATGLIGGALYRALREQRFEVHGVTRRLVADPRLHHADLAVSGEVADLLARVRPAVVVHLAGGRELSAADLYTSNVLPTSNLLQQAARLKCRPRFIVVGSAAEYGEPEAGVAKESSPLCPVTEYGRAKVAASALSEGLARAAELRVCIVRPFNVVSPCLPVETALGNMRHQLMSQEGEPRVVRCGRLDVVRDFVPLRFVVEVLSRLVTREVWPDRLNVCSGVGIVLGSVLEAMGDLLGVQVKPKEVPALAALPAAKRVVGDATRLHELGLYCEPTPASLARLMVGDWARWSPGSGGQRLTRT